MTKEGLFQLLDEETQKKVLKHFDQNYNELLKSTQIAKMNFYSQGVIDTYDSIFGKKFLRKLMDERTLENTRKSDIIGRIQKLLEELR